jgi:spermidine synthase
MLALAFVSGASSLVFELLWIRALGLYFGTTVAAITTVVATYTAGLALGSLVIGRRADRSAAPLRLYSGIELAIGCSAVLVSLLLLHGSGPLSVLARLSAASGPLAGVTRALCLSAILLVPTTLMGGTLPVLARARTHDGEGGRAVGLIYAFNTAGAVVGALLPDALLVPTFGMTITALVAALGNFTVALVARRLPEPAPVTVVAAVVSEAARAEPGPADTRARRLALILFAVSGLCAMAYEVLWSRVLEHLVEGLVISFSVLLAVYLVAVALGSRLTAARADRSASPVGWAALCLGGTGLLALAPMALLPRGHALIMGWFPEEPGVFRAPESHWWLVSLCCSLFLEGGACLLMGAAFPFLAAVSVRAGVAGQGSGRLYAVNAVAGVVGSFAAAYVLIPKLGVDRAFGVLAVLAVSTGAIVAFLATPSPRVRALGLGVAAVTVGILVTEPADQLRRSFLGGPTPDFVREGTTTSVAVVSHGSFGSTTWRELRTPGTTMSDTRFSARRYMGMMAHLPLMLASEHDSAVLVCFGVGNTARSLLSHPDLAHLEVVDISPEVLSASPYFAAVTGGVDPLLDPRTHVTVDDGRHHLLTTAATYDVVTSEPPPPNHAGVVNLYSREYYRAARRVLRPGGVVAQWLPVMQLSEDDILAMIGAMASELPYVELRYGFGYEWILLGSDRRPAPDADEQRRRVAFPSVVRDLASIGVRDFGDLTGTLLQEDAPLRALGELAPPVTDDLPSIEYPIASVLRPPRLPAGLADPPSPVMALVLRALPLRGVGSAEMQELALGSTLRAALRLAPAHPALLALLDVDDISRDTAAAWLAQHPDDARAAFVLARRAFYETDFAAAEARLAGIAADAPGAGVPVAAYWFLRAECARALGRADDAQAAAARAFAASGDPGFKAALAGAPRSSP